MKYTLNDSLGLIDARKCNDSFGCKLNIKIRDTLAKGAEIDLTESAANYLASKYPALLDAADSVKGVAKKSEITAPAK